MNGKKWSKAQRAKFNATMEAKRAGHLHVAKKDTTNMEAARFHLKVAMWLLEREVSK